MADASWIPVASTALGAVIALGGGLLAGARNDRADAVGAGCVLYSGGFTDSERLRATGKLVARSLSEAVELIYA